MRMAKQMREQGRRFKVEILGTTVVQVGDTVPLRGVVIEPDWKMTTRLEDGRICKGNNYQSLRN